MTQKINCPWCRSRVDNRLDKLADHIFKAHGDNVELCAWAEKEQVKLIKPVKQSIIKQILDIIQMYRGKPIGRILPKKQEKLPQYLKGQLPK